MMETDNGTKPSSNFSNVMNKFVKVVRLRSIGVISAEEENVSSCNGHSRNLDSSSDTTTTTTTTAGSKENEDNNSDQRVHPHPHPLDVVDSSGRNREAFEALISQLFANVSSLKSAYIELQDAHTPYDAEKIQLADKMVIAELKKLSDVKHAYRENLDLGNPLMYAKDTRLVSEFQEQQSLLKTYEVMVKKFQAQIQTKDAEIAGMKQKMEELHQKNVKIEKKMKRKGLLVGETGGSDDEEGAGGLFNVQLTHNLFLEMVELASRAAHDFSKPLISMMKAAGWDLDSAASAIEPDVVYARRSHKKYAFESYICRRMFSGFQEESFGVNSEGFSVSKEGFFHQFLAIKAMDALDVVSENAECAFGKFCRSKYLEVVHSKMEMSFFGNLDQRNYITNGGHPRTPFYIAFLQLAKAVWLLHRLAFSFEPKVEIFQVKKGSEASEVYMESVVKNVVPDDDDDQDNVGSGRVGFTVMPGFKIGGTVIQCKVYLSGMKYAD